MTTYVIRLSRIVEVPIEATSITEAGLKAKELEKLEPGIVILSVALPGVDLDLPSKPGSGPGGKPRGKPTGGGAPSAGICRIPQDLPAAIAA